MSTKMLNEMEVSRGKMQLRALGHYKEKILYPLMQRKYNLLLLLKPHLRPALRRKRLQTIENGSLVLHDNARCPVANRVHSLIRRWKWQLLQHPPNSPDMSPCEYDLFSKIKEPLRGIRFNQELTLEEVYIDQWYIYIYIEMALQME